jgi:pimeloyl-ACP methyl ester carboxylesterase
LYQAMTSKLSGRPHRRREQGDEMTETTTIKTLKVPGATLHYEVRGSGPVLLMIPGGPADAGIFMGLAGRLADRYTVVTYDPRGNSRSRLDGPPEDQRVEVHADDASRLLAAVGGGPAYVLGSSGGAVVGLELAARHPEQVQTLVAHEPPVVELLPDAPRWRAFFQDLYETYRRDGVGPAMQKFGEATGLGSGPKADASQMTPEMREGFARIQGNVPFFLEHVARAVTRYVPAIATLKAISSRVVIAGGEASGEQLAYRTAVALAERLGTPVVRFPGDHGGFVSHPDTFADRLHTVLCGSR